MDDSSAVGVVDDLGSALNDMVANFADQFSAAMSGAGSAVSGIDTSSLGSNVGAIDVPVNVDTSEADAALQGLDDQAATTTTDLGAIADTGAADALTQIGSDASDASSGLSSAGDAASNMASNSSGAKEGIDALGASVSGLKGISAAATGDLAGVAQEAQGFGPATAAGIAGVAALAGGLGVLVNSAIGTESALQRADAVLGTFKGAVENIKVGDLNISLDGLAAKMGESQTAMLNAATNAFQFADSAGVGGAAAARFSNEVLALASRAVAANPALGSVADVANTLELRLSAGGARLARYGIDLDTTSIKTLALAETGKTTAASLTAGEKAVAAADLATQKYGSTLKESVDNASKNAEIQVRQLKSSFEDFIGTMARPLIAPVLELFKELIPIGEDAAKILLSLGEAALPLVGAAAAVVGPVLSVIAEALNAIPTPALTAGIAILALAKAMATFAVAGEVTGTQGALVGLIAGARNLAAPVEAAGTAATAGAGGLAEFGAAAFAVAAPVAVGLAAAYGLYQVFGDTSNTATTLTTSLGLLKEGSNQYSQAVTGQLSAQTALAEVWGGMPPKLAAIQGQTELTTQAHTAFNTALAKSPGEAQLFIEQMQKAGQPVGEFKTQLANAAVASQAVASANAQVTAQTDPLATSFKDAATAAGQEVSALNELSDALLAAGNADVAAAQAGVAFEKAVASGDQLTIQSAALKVDATTKTKVYNDEILAGIPPQKAAADAVTAGNFALQAAANALLPDSPAKQALDALILKADAYGQEHPNPTVDANTDPANKKLGDTKHLVDTFPTHINITIDAAISAAGQAAFAAASKFFTGGPQPAMAGASTSAGQAFVVGEAGPELFIAPSAGQIVPNDQAVSLAGSGSNADLATAAIHLDSAATALQSGGGQVQVIMVSASQAVALVPRAAQPAVSAFLAGRG